MGDVSYKLLIKLALEKECPDAMFRLAYRYKLGLGQEQDMPLARRLLHDAAKARHEFAMWMTAICFSDGKWGFPVDKNRAGYWYLQLWKKWLIDAGRGDTTARRFIEIYRIDQIQSPRLRQRLGLPPLQTPLAQSE